MLAAAFNKGLDWTILNDNSFLIKTISDANDGTGVLNHSRRQSHCFHMSSGLNRPPGISTQTTLGLD